MTISSATLYLLQFVIVSLAGWGTLFYGGYKFFTKGKREDKEEVIISWTHCWNKHWSCLSNLLVTYRVTTSLFRWLKPSKQIVHRWYLVPIACGFTCTFFSSTDLAVVVCVLILPKLRGNPSFDLISCLGLFCRKLEKDQSRFEVVS